MAELVFIPIYAEICALAYTSITEGKSLIGLLFHISTTH
jgi:hypothetical protein